VRHCPNKAFFHMSLVAILAFGVAASWQSVRLALCHLHARWAWLRHPPPRGKLQSITRTDASAA
jgi:hypothetical protein